MRKFYNRPNTCCKTDDGEIWISRSVAVVGIVIAIDDYGQRYILVTTRSEKMNHAGKRCMPCGYLDWDENTYNAMVREVYEETSLYLPYYKGYISFDNNKKPIVIQDEPSEDKLQNISFIFVTFLDFMGSGRSGDHNAFPYHVTEYTSDENSKVEWMREDEFYSKYQHEPWAFDHDIRIKKTLSLYQE